MPKSLKVLRRRPHGGDRNCFGKNLQNDLGSLPDRSRGFAGLRAPGIVFFFFPRKQDFLKQALNKICVVITRFVQQLFESCGNVVHDLSKSRPRAAQKSSMRGPEHLENSPPDDFQTSSKSGLTSCLKTFQILEAKKKVCVVA